MSMHGPAWTLTAAAIVVCAGISVVERTLAAQQQAAAPYTPKQSDRPRHWTATKRDSSRFRRQDAGRMGGRSGLLARRERRAGRRDHATDRREEQHLCHLARRTTKRLRTQAGLPDHRGRQQRHQLSQCRRARSGHTGQPICHARLPVRHRRAQAHAGNNYEEKGRLFLAMRGQVTRVVGGRPPVLLSSFGDADALAAYITDDWNAVHLIVRGNTLTT